MLIPVFPHWNHRHCTNQGAQDEDAIAAQYGGMDVLNEILGQLRGEAPSPVTSSVPDLAVDPNKGFVKKGSVSPSPLAKLDAPEE